MNRSALVIALAITCVPAALAEEDAKPWSMADAYYGAAEMADARERLQESHGNQTGTYIEADRFEYQSGGDNERLVLDGNAWIGGDMNKFWLKAEGEYASDEGRFEDAEIQALWSRAISPYFDVQAGLRQDFEPEGRTHAVLSLQGLAPYLFEVDSAAFLSADGDLTARVEVEYELLLTQRLILQPRAELAFSAQDIPELETGAGLTGLDLGLRLRYEAVREFAPYVGVEWQERFGGTADYREAAGEDAGQTVFLVGLRAWY